MSARKTWTMPKWMEPYRDHFANTGGNPIEELMNDEHTNSFSNSVRSALIVAVASQVSLLERMHANGMLTRAPSREEANP